MFAAFADDRFAQIFSQIAGDSFPVDQFVAFVVDLLYTQALDELFKGPVICLVNAQEHDLPGGFIAGMTVVVGVSDKAKGEAASAVQGAIGVFAGIIGVPAFLSTKIGSPALSLLSNW